MMNIRFSLSGPGVFLFLLLIGLLIYSNSIAHPFVHDDLVFIRHNPDIGNLDQWPSLFLTASMPVPGIAIINPYYRPLLSLLYRIQYRMFGFEVVGYHLFNILIHVINAWLVFLILSTGLNLVVRESPTAVASLRSLAWWTAVLFLVHPVQSEAVACIAGVSNLLFSLLSLLSLWLYVRLRFFNLSAGQRGAALSGSYGFYVMALLCKEQAIFVPVCLLALEAGLIYYRLQAIPEVITPLTVTEERSWTWADKNQRGALRMIGGFVILTLLYFVWRKSVMGQATTVFADNLGELILRLKAIPQTLLIYWRILVFPQGLHYMRSLDVLRPTIGSWLVFFLCLGGMGLLIRRLPQQKGFLAAAGLVWFFITLGPVLNVIPLIHEYSWIAIFEHFLYLPSAGFFFFLLVVGENFLHDVIQWRSAQTGQVALLLLVVVLSGMTVRQNLFWRHEIPLFERALRYEPYLGRLRLLLGKAYYYAGQMPEAEHQLSAARKIMKGYYAKSRETRARGFYEFFLKEINFVLAHVREQQKRYRAAIELYEQALVYDPRDSRLHKGIGVNLIRLNEWTGAIPYFQKAVELNPSDIGSMNNLAACLMETGNHKQARQLLEHVLRLDSQYKPAQHNLLRMQERKAAP